MRILKILAISTALLVGCSAFNKSTQTKNIDLLSDQTCEAPCFLGITPGVTSESEARTVIYNSDRLLNCADYDNTEQSGAKWIRCDAIAFVFLDNGVVWISITPLNLTVEQVIQKYGIPDALSVLLVSRPDEPYRSEAVFRYDQFRLQVNLIEAMGNRYEITPNTQVKSITFLNENEQDLLKNTILDNWKGYGLYP